MNFWPFQILVAITLTSFVIVIIIFARYKLFNTERKVKEDKVLLKQLLEGFDLEIPTELQETDGVTITQIDGN